MEIVKEITLIFGIACLLGVLASFLKLPLIVAYLATGIVIGPVGFNLIGLESDGMATIQGLTNLGIAFMLFLVGLEIDIKQFKSASLNIVLVSLWQMLITFAAGSIISGLFGFDYVSSLYIGIAIAFSSTVIVVRNLSDSLQLKSLHGRMLVGILLVQDVIAILVLIFLNTSGASLGIGSASVTLLSVLIFGIAVYAMRVLLLQSIFDIFSHTTELLFVSSIAWALFLSFLAEQLGFSLAIGAFIAGITLAPLPYAQEIQGRIKWLRDFFIVLFFSLVGVTIEKSSASGLLLPILALSTLAVFGKMLIISTLMGLTGFRKRTTFITATYLSQISEFSIILIAVGISLKQIDSSVSSVVIYTALITMAVSSLLSANINGIYHRIAGFLKVFERPGHFRDDFHTLAQKMENHVILFGANRVGGPVLDKLKKLNHKTVVVDFDPDIIKRLRDKNIISIYGDMGDSEMLDNLFLDKAKMIVSTVKDVIDTKTIIKKIKSVNKSATIFVTAQTAEEALDLYSEGADYVILPHHLSGEFLADMIGQINENAPKTTEQFISRRKYSHINELNKIIAYNLPA